MEKMKLNLQLFGTWKGTDTGSSWTNWAKMTDQSGCDIGYNTVTRSGNTVTINFGIRLKTNASSFAYALIGYNHYEISGTYATGSGGGTGNGSGYFAKNNKNLGTGGRNKCYYAYCLPSNTACLASSLTPCTTETFKFTATATVNCAAAGTLTLKGMGRRGHSSSAQGNPTISVPYPAAQFYITVTGGTGISSTSGSGWYDYGTSVTISATVDTGNHYHWSHWSDGGAQSHAITVTGTATYTAYAARDQYTITLNKDAGFSSVSGAGTYDYGSSVTIGATLNSNYQWHSWSDGGAQSHAVTVTGNATYTAYSKVWNDVNVLNPNGTQDYLSGYFDLYTSEDNSWRYNLLNEDSDMTHKLGTYFQVQNIRSYTSYYTLDKVEGHDSTPASGAYRKTFDAPNEVLSIKMKWSDYSVKYNANGGSSTPTGQYVVCNGTATLASAISRNNSSSSGTRTITFNANGGTGGPTTSTGTYTDTTSYTFNKWALNSTSGTQYDAGGSYTVPATISTFYALWNSSTVRTGNQVTLSSSQPTQSGYNFLGWADSASATTPNYYGGQTYTFTADKTIYAVWEVAVTAPVIYKKDNGTWKEGTPYVKVKGEWKEATEVYIKINGTWVQSG